MTNKYTITSLVAAFMTASFLVGCEEKKSEPPSKSTTATKQPEYTPYTPSPRTEDAGSTKCKPSSSYSESKDPDADSPDGTEGESPRTSGCPKKKTPSELGGAGGGLGGLLGGLFGDGGFFDIGGILKMVPKIIDAIGDIIASFTGGGGGLSSPARSDVPSSSAPKTK